MLIEIEDDVFTKVLEIVELRSKKVYNQIKDIQPITTLSIDNTLTKAREAKTLQVKEKIKTAIRELIQAKAKLSKYNVHKSTNIAYVTLNKYFDEILKEVQDEH